MTVKTTQSLSCPQMPLAVYREVAAHLRQVEGVSVVLLPQKDESFAYLKSQIAGLKLDYDTSPTQEAQEQIEAILAYYAQQHGQWKEINLS